MRHVALGLFAAASFATAAQAVPVRYDFNGILTTDQTASSFAAEAGLATNTGSFSGHITFSSLAADSDPSAAELYEAIEFELLIGSYTFSSADIGFTAADERVDASQPAFFLDFNSSSDFTPLFDDESMGLTLSFDNAVPGVTQNPGLGNATADLILATSADDFLWAHGTVAQLTTTPSAVPESSTWAMLIGGIAVVGGTMRSGRRAPLGRAVT